MLMMGSHCDCSDASRSGDAKKSDRDRRRIDDEFQTLPIAKTGTHLTSLPDPAPAELGPLDCHASGDLDILFQEEHSHLLLDPERVHGPACASLRSRSKEQCTSRSKRTLTASTPAAIPSSERVFRPSLMTCIGHVSFKIVWPSAHLLVFPSGAQGIECTSALVS